MKHPVFQFLFFSVFICNAQVNVSGGFGAVISDIKGTPVVSNRNSEIEGSPFLVDTWLTGDITLKNGAKINNIATRLNLATNELHIMKTENGINTEIIVQSGSISAVTIYESAVTGLNGRNFGIGFPAVDGFNQNTFYEIIVNGPASLVKNLRKKVVEEKPFNSAVATKKFVEYENYYVFVGGKMNRYKKGKEFILQVLEDKKNEIEKFLTENRIKCRTENDCSKVLEYYNSIID
ncbi:MAG: hypothetical protein ACKOE6_06675 [Flammeovirgaceae bacterium]